jgi:hypothetical protein
MTDSSTVAMPSTTSPSPGISSPALAMTISPERNFEAGTTSIFPLPDTRFAIESVFVLRRVSACALPRASAIASAKLAKSTVNQSHSEIWSWKPTFPAAPVKTSRSKKIVTRAAPTSTTNMTGFFRSVSGFSFTKESLLARRTMSGSNRGRARTSLTGRRDVRSCEDGDLGVLEGGG